MKQALIIWGGWQGHEPEACAHILARMLDDAGMSVRIQTDTKALLDPALGELALIVPIMTMASIEKDELANLDNAIRAGTGLAGFHGGMGDAFRNAPGYQFICGGQWVAHPGDIIDYQVDIARPDDPIMAGIESFAYHSEQYYMHVDPANEVLATTTFTGEHDPATEGVAMPVVWKRRHGAGRIFYSSLGHSADEFQNPDMATIMRRGMIWASVP